MVDSVAVVSVDGDCSDAQACYSLQHRGARREHSAGCYLHFIKNSKIQDKYDEWFGK